MSNTQTCLTVGMGTACPETNNHMATIAHLSLATDEALELLRATHERIEQMTVVAQSIKADLLYNGSRNTKVLAELAAFLGYEWAGYVDAQVTDLQKRLDMHGGSL